MKNDIGYRIPNPGEKMFCVCHHQKVLPCVIDAVYIKEDEIWITLVEKYCQISGSKMASYDLGAVLFYTKKEAEEELKRRRENNED